MRIFIPTILAAIVMGGWLVISHSTATQESTYNRVMQSKVLRCSYMLWDPVVTRDFGTNKMHGIAVDYVEKVAARNGLEVQWTEEVPIDQLPANLNANRTDMFCLPCSPTSDFDKVLAFVGSFGFLPYYIYVPYDSKITAEHLKAAHFTVVDGYIPSTVTPQVFPHSKITSLPITTSMGQLYDELRYGKTDALINEHVTALEYMKHNPKIIRRFSDKPVNVKPMSFPVKKNDARWHTYVNEIFGDTPENRKLLADLAAKYGLTDNALLMEKP